MFNLFFLLITCQPGIDNFLDLIYFILSVNLCFVLLNSQTQKKTVVFDLDNEDDAPVDQLTKENNESASRSKCEEVSQSASASTSSEVKSSNRGSLVQATISSLFKKVEEKVSF